MVRYRRNWVPGGTFFFTVALADRHSDRLTAQAGLLRDALRKVRLEQPFTIDAIVVLPDHLHTIFTLPPGDADFALRWRRIKSIFTHGLIRRGIDLRPRDHTGAALWQRRFWEHTIRNDTDYACHVDYIHYNPVKHSYVADPAEWPFSSLRHFVRNGTLPEGWGAGAQADEQDFGEPR